MAVEVGPWGDNDETNRKDYRLKDGRKLINITVYKAEYVRGIEFTDADANGNNPSAPFLIGEKNGDPLPFPIDGKRINEITGSVYSPYGGSKIIKSLYFGSNENPGPYGAQEIPFSLPLPKCDVSGSFASYDGGYIINWGVILS